MTKDEAEKRAYKACWHLSKQENVAGYMFDRGCDWQKEQDAVEIAELKRKLEVTVEALKDIVRKEQKTDPLTEITIYGTSAKIAQRAIDNTGEIDASKEIILANALKNIANVNQEIPVTAMIFCIMQARAALSEIEKKEGV